MPLSDQTSPIRSMTGFASVRADTPLGSITVSLRSVNHRGLDLHFHLGSDFAAFENDMRALLKQHIGRGHVEVRCSMDRDSASEVAFNERLVGDYLKFFRKASAEFGLDGKPDLNALLALPGVFEPVRNDVKPLDSAFTPQVTDALRACIHQLNTFREREGGQLVASFEREICALETDAERISLIRADAQQQVLTRLTERIKTLLGGSGVSETRLAEEAALIADRSDIQEELTRLTVHTGELKRVLVAGGETGKRLDFLLQEMNRETNTILSKTSGIGDVGLTVTNLGLSIKANIERMREQALNLE